MNRCLQGSKMHLAPSLNLPNTGAAKSKMANAKHVVCRCIMCVSVLDGPKGLHSAGFLVWWSVLGELRVIKIDNSGD